MGRGTLKGTVTKNAISITLSKEVDTMLEKALVKLGFKSKSRLIDECVREQLNPQQTITVGKIHAHIKDITELLKKLT